MYSPNISEADIEKVRYYKRYSKSALIRQRMHVLYLRYQSLNPGATAKAADVHANSVTRWTKIYMEQGIEGLLAVKTYRPKSDLLNYTEQIKENFEKSPPQSIGQARKRIEQITGLQRSITQIRKFVKRILGYSYRRYSPLPGGRKSIESLAEEQEDFLKTTLHPLLEKAYRGLCEVFYVDATHPVMGFYNGQAWSDKPLKVRTSSGRTRINILGALNASNNELFSITTKDYIKAGTVVEMLDFLREELPGKRIHLILDNARYQRCKLVKQVAKKNNIHLVFLPAYSPNLNLIERLWKFLKKQVLVGKYYNSKEEFFSAIDCFIDQINEGEFEQEIKSLMKPNFQKLKRA